MAVNREGSTLLATSGDGTLTVLDLRQKKLEHHSDTNESELLSLAIVKVSQEGVMCVAMESMGSCSTYREGVR